MFNKISWEKIFIAAKGENLSFSVKITDEKQLNIAAGKIHRATISDEWSIHGQTVTYTPKTKSFSFKEVDQMFERVVT
jgi:hypothetical protein